MTGRIFLSHSNRDKEAVRRLAKDLDESDIKVWLDEQQIKVGDPILGKVSGGLKSDFLGVWLTKDAVESGWVKHEFETAFLRQLMSKTTMVLPLLAEDCDIPSELEGIKYADFREDYQQGLMDLLTALHRALHPQSYTNDLGMKLNLILPGIFHMGSEASHEENEKPAHKVAITRSFYLGIHAVTQQHWKEVMGTEPWKHQHKVKEDNQCPAIHVSWYDTLKFISRLNERDKDHAYYLPTEAEWEYAARAGSTTEFCFGNEERDLGNYAWYKDNTNEGEEYAHPVGRKRPNNWGLYDMHGNVWEWVDNWYYGSYNARINYSPTEKVLRGGGWDYPAVGARSAFRNHLLPTRSYNVVGFRLVARAIPSEG